jgi:hypothetical protein
MRLPALGKTHEEALGTYRGFDALAWPHEDHPGFRVHDGVARLSDLAQVRAYLASLPDYAECDLIAIGTESTKPPPNWRFLGLDVGYFQSEWDRFSVLLNEVVYGAHEDLRRHAASLNRYLLLDSEAPARALLRERAEIARQGGDVEEGEMNTIAVFEPERE